MTLIKIDRSSIKENENAGQTQFYNLIHTEGDFEVRYTRSEMDMIRNPGPDIRDDLEFMDERIRLVQKHRQTDVHGMRLSFKYLFAAISGLELELMYNALVDVFGKDGVSFQYRNVYRDINLLQPVPKYSYEYEATEVECQHCHAKFSHTTVRDEDDYDHEGSYCGRRNICPKCGEEDCCEFSFESLDSVLLEKAGLPRLVVR